MPRLCTALRRAILLLVCLTALSGCAKSLVTTHVNADGSWSRAVKLTAPRHDKPATMTAGPSVQEAFVLPSGGTWKTRWDRDKDNVSYVAEISLRPGEAQHHDVVVRSKKGVPELVNDATVTQVKPGTWEYRETLHWSGPPDATERLDDPESLSNIKAALPPALATDDNARALVKSLMPSIWQALWGPPTPLVSELIMHPDLGANLLAQRLGRSLDETLQKQFGDRLSSDQRLDVERKMLASFVDTVKTRGQSSTGPGDNAGPDTKDDPKKDETQPVALTFVTKVPGQVVSTNGEVNPITQEVFWGLYPEAAEMGDVVLIVTYQTEK